MINGSELTVRGGRVIDYRREDLDVGHLGQREEVHGEKVEETEAEAGYPVGQHQAVEPLEVFAAG
jgi:hypothetical protein